MKQTFFYAMEPTPNAQEQQAEWMQHFVYFICDISNYQETALGPPYRI